MLGLASASCAWPATGLKSWFMSINGSPPLRNPVCSAEGIGVARLPFSPHRMLPMNAACPVDRVVVENFKPEQTALSKVASLDWKRSLLETFAINERANQKLLEGLNEHPAGRVPTSSRTWWHLWAT